MMRALLLALAALLAAAPAQAQSCPASMPDSAFRVCVFNLLRSLQTEIDDATAADEDLLAEVAALSEQVLEQAEDIAVIDGDVAGLGTRVSTTESGINDVRGAVTELTTRVNDLTTTVGQQQDGLNDLGDDVLSIEGGVVLLQYELGVLEAAVAELEVALGCDGTTRTWYRDADGDGYHDPATALESCPQPAGYILAGLGADCDDGDEALHTEAIWYADVDGDGYHNEADTIESCEQPVGYIVGALDEDCDDGDLLVGGPFEMFLDLDGYGDPATSIEDCELDAGWVENGDDCHDGAITVYPGAPEDCGDGYDNDCDGDVDVADTRACVRSCTDVYRRSGPEGPNLVYPEGYPDGLLVDCEGPTTVVEPDLAGLYLDEWLSVFEVVSNDATWDPGIHSGLEEDGFWVQHVRNTSGGWNGYAQCVRAYLVLPWEMTEYSGAWDALSFSSTGPEGHDDDDGLTWGYPAPGPPDEATGIDYDMLGRGHVMFGAEYDDGSIETSKEAGVRDGTSAHDWGQDWSADPDTVLTWSIEATLLAERTDRVVWEFCDDGNDDENIYVRDIELRIEVPASDE